MNSKRARWTHHLQRSGSRGGQKIDGWVNLNAYPLLSITSPISALLLRGKSYLPDIELVITSFHVDRRYIIFAQAILGSGSHFKLWMLNVLSVVAEKYR